MATQQLYIGTYTKNEPHVEGLAKGIYHYELNGTTGELTHLHTAAGVENPSFLAIDSAGRRLFAAGEVGEYEGAPTGYLSAYTVGPEGELVPINRVASGGIAPCHLQVDATGRWLLVANYGSGTVAMFPVREDGSLGPMSHRVQHEGSGPNAKRQEGPHAHSINVAPDNRFAVAADLGTDELRVYRLDLIQGLLQFVPAASTTVQPGAGPRHIDFHPNGRLVFVINELDSTITALAYTAETGALTPVDTVSTLPPSYRGNTTCADIHVHPNGHFVYGSNRGHDSIACFSVDDTSGGLTLVDHFSTGGRTPRNFALSPEGDFLLAANQDSNSVITFALDLETGSLREIASTTVPSPVCVRFLT